MFEYHGWIKVRASAACPDESLDEELPPEADEAIRTLVGQLPDYGLRSYRQLNVENFVHLAGVRNHRSGGEPIIELFHRVGELAPGSYGLLYVHDDEDGIGLDNEYQVFRMVRGTVSREQDRFLSPCIPTVEDRCSWE